MLVLSRHRDETSIIGDEIELTVVDIRGDKVRLGIKAPAHIAVHRKEVYEAIRRENEQAARLTDSHFGSISPGPPAMRRKQQNGPASQLSQRPSPTTRRESA